MPDLDKAYTAAHSRHDQGNRQMRVHEAARPDVIEEGHVLAVGTVGHRAARKFISPGRTVGSEFDSAIHRVK